MGGAGAGRPAERHGRQNTEPEPEREPAEAGEAGTGRGDRVSADRGVVYVAAGPVEGGHVEDGGLTGQCDPLHGEGSFQTGAALLSRRGRLRGGRR